MPCGHLLGKGWPIGSRLWFLIVKLSLSPLVSWVRCGVWLYRFPIFVPLSYFVKVCRITCTRKNSKLFFPGLDIMSRRNCGDLINNDKQWIRRMSCFPNHHHSWVIQFSYNETQITIRYIIHLLVMFSIKKEDKSHLITTHYDKKVGSNTLTCKWWQSCDLSANSWHSSVCLNFKSVLAEQSHWHWVMVSYCDH